MEDPCGQDHAQGRGRVQILDRKQQGCMKQTGYDGNFVRH